MPLPGSERTGAVTVDCGAGGSSHFPVAASNIQRAIRAAGQLFLGKEESEALRQRLLGGATGLVALRVAFSGCSFVASILLARLLGAAGFGAYSYSLAWVVLISVPAILGMDQLLARDVAVYHTRQQWGRLRGLLRKVTASVFLASFGLVTLAALIACIMLRGSGNSQERLTFLLALPLVPLITLTRARQSAMQGLHRVAMGAMPEQLIPLGLMLVLLGLAYLYPHYRLTAPIAMGLNVGANAVAFAVGTVLLCRTIPLEVKEAEPVYKGLALWRSAVPLLFISGANVLFGQSDTLIVGTLKSAAAVGAYSVAHKGADFISFALNVQDSAFISTAASLYAAGELKRLQRLITRLARLTFLAVVPLGIFLTFFGHWFLSFYGPQFGHARTALAVLGFSQLFNVAFGSPGMLLIVTGFERDAAIAVGAGAAANIAFNLTLVPRWGMVGAAVGYTIGMVVWNVWMTVALYCKVGIHGTIFGRLYFGRPTAES